MELLDATQPSMVTCPSSWPIPIPDFWSWAAEHGVAVRLVLYSTFPGTGIPNDQDALRDETEFRNQWIDCPDAAALADSTASWFAHVKRWTRYVQLFREQPEGTVAVHYDIWNEPDLDWNVDMTTPTAIPDPVQFFYEIWGATVDSIRVWDPDGIIAGPSLACGCEGADPNGPTPPSGSYNCVDDATGIRLQPLLEYCRQHGCMPDVINWHDIGFPGYKMSSMDDPTGYRRNLYAQVVRVREIIDDVFEASAPGADTTAATFSYSINEMIDGKDPWETFVHPWLQPGIIVRQFALAERARSDNLGLLCAARSYWCDPCQTCYGACESPSYNYPAPKDQLCGLVAPGCTGSHGACPSEFDQCNTAEYDSTSLALHAKRFAWWTYKAYADMAGSFVAVDWGDSTDALASVDLTEGTGRILVGNFASTTAVPLTLQLENIPGALVVNDAVRVRVDRLRGGADWNFIGGVFPDSVSEQNYLVEDGATEIRVDSSLFGPGDALSILVQPFTPSTTIAPGTYERIQDAIDATEVGNYARIEDRPEGYLESLHLKNGVRVLAPLDTLVTIRAVGDTAIVFPENAVGFTALSGVQVLPAASTDVLVVLRGNGALMDCVLDDGDYSPDRHLWIEGGSPTVTGCSIVADSPSYRAMGIYLSDGTTAVVDSCSIDVRNGYSTSTGIETDGTSGAEIRNTFVTSMDTGMKVYGATRVIGCTVDSTTKTGIIANDETLIERTIVSNVLQGASYYGIDSGDTVRYCIAPDGILAPDTLGNSLADPLYCPDAYTLRFDSYGSPWNNPSGKQIGAYPVVCGHGTLQRDTRFGDGIVRLVGDVIVPASRTLALLPGAEVEVDSSNVETPGEPALIDVRGTGILRIAGLDTAMVYIRGVDPTPGSWDGVRANGDSARVLLEHADIRHAWTCVRDDNYYPADSLSLRHVTLAEFEDSGLRANHLGSDQTGGAVLRVENCVIDMTGATGTGLWVGRMDGNLNEDAGVLPGYDIEIEATTVVGDGTGEHGIYVNDGRSSGYPGAEISHVLVSGLTQGTGIELAGLAPTLSRTSYDSIETGIEDCKWGLKLRGGSTPIVSGLSGHTLAIENCTTGIYAADSAAVEVEYVSITPTSGGIGLYTDDTASGSFSHLSITGGATGIKAYSTAEHTLRSSAVTGFTANGVYVSVAGMPNLGEDGDDGNNNIYKAVGDTLATPKYVSAKTRLGGLGPVMAEGNWWGISPAPSVKFTANVDYFPWKTGQVSLSFRRGLGLTVAPAEVALAFRPNPFVGGGEVSFSLPVEPGAWRVDLFDAQGRRVRTLDQGNGEAGAIRTVRWDGRNDEGRPVAVGIYFLRLRALGTTRTVKIVRLP